MHCRQRIQLQRGVQLSVSFTSAGVNRQRLSSPCSTHSGLITISSYGPSAVNTFIASSLARLEERRSRRHHARMTKSSTPEQSPAHCGSKPKRLAVGIAPLGTVSIGIVPMGVICIGVVPMGVVSIGVVAMGVINLSIVGMGLLAIGVNTMGVWTAGPMNMGLIQLGNQKQTTGHDHSSHQNGHGTSDHEDDPRFMAYPTRAQAEAQARIIGCDGVHRMGSHWMACADHATGDH